MAVLANRNQCTGCAACVNICRNQCISMKPDSEGFLYPIVSSDKCTNCGLCQTVCPVLNFSAASNEPIAYAAYTKNTDIHINSSSGGVFTEIAKYILDNDGVVYGAAYLNPVRIAHKGVMNLEDLAALRGSKYTQSEIGLIYSEIKKTLKTGKMVLFSGTPCQVEGLKSFLIDDYRNLFTQDLICHGVPSPMIWAQYIKLIETQSASHVERVNFRDKTYGWKDFSLHMTFSNKLTYCNKFSNDLFMKGFLNDIYLRPSCYGCLYKSTKRKSDFTLADFWGIDRVYPEMHHRLGTSLVWLNSKKAFVIWEEIQKNMVVKEVELQKAICYNSAAITASPCPKTREEFFKTLNEHNLLEAINQFVPKQIPICKLVKKIIKFVVSAMRKFILRFTIRRED